MYIYTAVRLNSHQTTETNKTTNRVIQLQAKTQDEYISFIKTRPSIHRVIDAFLYSTSPSKMFRVGV